MTHLTLWIPSYAGQDSCEGRWLVCSFWVRSIPRHFHKSCRFACVSCSQWRSTAQWIFVVRDLEKGTEAEREGMEGSWAPGNPHWWRGRNAVKATRILSLVYHSQKLFSLKQGVKRSLVYMLIMKKNYNPPLSNNFKQILDNQKHSLKFVLVTVVFLQFLVQSFMNEWQSLKTSDQH